MKQERLPENGEPLDVLRGSVPVGAQAAEQAVCFQEVFGPGVAAAVKDHQLFFLSP
jgi:hypothetical protein